MNNFQPVDILIFQAGREAVIANQKRDLRKHRDWQAGYEQVKPMREKNNATDQ